MEAALCWAREGASLGRERGAPLPVTLGKSFPSFALGLPVCRMGDSGSLPESGGAV